eukprot:m.298778 g.298778  ORF g.298778 m.298778 type:complete len:449 (+) comp16292_c0_seq5:39-1385(+)
MSDLSRRGIISNWFPTARSLVWLYACGQRALRSHLGTARTDISAIRQRPALFGRELVDRHRLSRFLCRESRLAGIASARALDVRAGALLSTVLRALEHDTPRHPDEQHEDHHHHHSDCGGVAPRAGRGDGGGSRRRRGPAHRAGRRHRQRDQRGVVPAEGHRNGVARGHRRHGTGRGRWRQHCLAETRLEVHGVGASPARGELGPSHVGRRQRHAVPSVPAVEPLEQPKLAVPPQVLPLAAGEGGQGRGQRERQHHRRLVLRLQRRSQRGHPLHWGQRRAEGGHRQGRGDGDGRRRHRCVRHHRRRDRRERGRRKRHGRERVGGGRRRRGPGHWRLRIGRRRGHGGKRHRSIRVRWSERRRRERGGRERVGGRRGERRPRDGGLRLGRRGGHGCVRNRRGTVGWRERCRCERDRRKRVGGPSGRRRPRAWRERPSRRRGDRSKRHGRG